MSHGRLSGMISSDSRMNQYVYDMSPPAERLESRYKRPEAVHARADLESITRVMDSELVGSLYGGVQPSHSLGPLDEPGLPEYRIQTSWPGVANEERPLAPDSLLWLKNHRCNATPLHCFWGACPNGDIEPPFHEALTK
jgi:hypothetical protein